MEETTQGSDERAVPPSTGGGACRVIALAAFVLGAIVIVGVLVAAHVVAQRQRHIVGPGEPRPAELETRFVVRPKKPANLDQLARLAEVTEGRVSACRRAERFAVWIGPDSVEVLLAPAAFRDEIASIQSGLSNTGPRFWVALVTEGGEKSIVLRNRDGGETRVWDDPVLTDESLLDVYRSTDSQMRAAIGITLTREASKKFYDFTSANIGKPAALIIDDEVVVAPVIRSAISDRLIIEGGASGFTEEQVGRMIRSLKGWHRYPMAVDVEAREAGSR
jgi:hypothetical protein